ncbi:hypothetical protein IV84_GL002062 [Pediococcus damnosus]|nr:hypothetical protein IV84_GL002062 [Pediococcus damnosus]
MTKKNTLDGLTQAEADRRLARDGFNEVAETPFNFATAIITRLWGPSAWILEAALIIEIVLGKGIQAGFIVLMLLFAAVNGAIQSCRANTVLRSLSHDLSPTTAVSRDGKWKQVSAKYLVVDDLISLRQGDIIPADARLLTDTLEANESSITGEAKAVNRPPGAGTEVLSGNALAIVTATGANSRSGKTISLINQSSAPGHLQKLLGKIIGYLAALDAVLAVLLIIVAVVRHEDLVAMLPFLAMLFIATIPIAMPSSFAGRRTDPDHRDPRCRPPRLSTHDDLDDHQTFMHRRVAAAIDIRLPDSPLHSADLKRDDLGRNSE